MRLRTTFLAFALLAAWLHSGSSNSAEIWYEDNNLGTTTEMPVDFVEKFRQPERFQEASHHIRVYLLRTHWLDKMNDDFFTSLLIPYLQKNNIKLALNSPGAIWYGAKPRAQERFDADIDLLKRLKRLGVHVDYISMQSILSKPLRRAGRGSEIVEFPIDRRVAGAVAFARAAREVFPSVAFGIIDALPGKGLEYKEAYRRLADALREAGIGLAYIHVDVSFDVARTGRNGVTWASLREAERYVENDIGVQFGVFAVSRKGGRRSSKAFHDASIEMLQCYAGSRGTPRDYIIASWFPHPETTIPETATGDDYPMMRTVLDFGRQLDRIKTAGEAWVAQRQSDTSWLRQCGIANPN